MIRSVTHNGVQMVLRVMQRSGGYVGIATFEGATVCAPSDFSEPLYPTMVSAMEAAEEVGRLAINIGAWAPRRERERRVKPGVFLALQRDA